MDDSVAFNVINTNQDVPDISTVTDLVKTMADHQIEDVHLNSKHGRSVILRNFYSNTIQPHQYDHKLKPVRVFLNKPLRKGLDAMGSRAIYNQILDSLI